MKKLIALAMVCGFAFAFVACGGGAKTEDTVATDTVTTPVPAPDTVKLDSADTAAL